MPVDLEHRLVRRPGGRPLRRELAALVLLAGTGSLTGSVCLLAQAVRHGAIALGYLLALGVLRLTRRRGGAHFDYGLEKLARLSELFLGLALVGGSLALLSQAPTLAASFSREAPATVALAAVVYGACMLWSWRSEAGRDWARPTGLLAGVALTLATLGGDREVTMAADLAGGLLLLGLATLHGARVFLDALRDVVDAPAREDLLAPTLACLYGAGIAAGEVRGLRSRQLAGSLFLELHLAPPDAEPLRSVQERVARARRAATTLPHWLDLSVRLVEP